MEKKELFKIMIDPGHGGKDPGALGKFSVEKNLNLIFANILFNKLSNDEWFLPLMTRLSDQYITLADRVAMAVGEDVHAFISIHCNASTSEKPNDCQIYYHDEEKDKPLAEILFKYVDKIDYDTSKWSREIQANFYVLRKLKNYPIPAILIEIGFLTNKKDEEMLNDPDFQEKFSEGLYNGLKNYFNKL